MIATSLIEDALANRLATDTTTLAIATFLDVALIAAPFTPGPNLTAAMLTLAAAAGMTLKTTTSATILVYRDPDSGDYIIEVPAPVGGFVFIATGAGLPETYHGFALLDHVDNTILLAAEQFTAPETINAAGQGIDLGGTVKFRLPSGVMT